MKYYDVSMLIEPNMQVYNNKPSKKPLFTNASNFETGSAYETDIKMNVHTGTHMDFPLHMIPNGKTSTDFDFTRLLCTVKVFDLTHVNDHIDFHDLIDLDIESNDFVLFKTKNSQKETFDFEFIYVNEQASIYLCEKKVAGVGVDGLGIERAQTGHPTHKHLLNMDILIVEGLRLKDVPEGKYEMIALPLKMDGMDALPLRVILKELS